VQQAGPGEILGGRIGPRMRPLAMYLRNEIGISYRKVPRALAEMLEFSFVEDVKQWVKRGCQFHRQRGLNELSPKALTTESVWLRAELSRLEGCLLDHEKALTLQARLQRHHDEWLVFVDDPRVPPTNNLAERKLRPLVVLRKVTFGHRTETGARRLAKIMTVQETAKTHGHKASDFFYYLQTHSAARSLRHFYSGP
jgi:hypothetical protein